MIRIVPTEQRPLRDDVWRRERLFGNSARRVEDAIETRIDSPHTADFSDTLRDGGIFGSMTPTFAQLCPETPERARQVAAGLRRAGYPDAGSHETLSAVRYVGLMASIVIFGSLLLW